MPGQRRLFGLAVNPHVGNVLQPPSCNLIELFQRVEGAAVEQADLDKVHAFFDFALGLRAPPLASPGFETVVGGESQKAWVVNRPLVVVPQDDDLLVVVEAGGSDALEMDKGTGMFADSREEILGIDKTHILASRIGQ